MTALLRRALLLLPLLLLGGCFEYTEDVYVQRDGGGRLTTDVGVWEVLLEPDQLAEMRAELQRAAADLGQREGVRKATFHDELRADMHHFVLDVEVAEFRRLSELAGGAGLALATPFGAGRACDDATLRFEELEGGRLRYVRVLDPEAEGLVRARAARVRAKLLAAAHPGDVQTAGAVDPGDPLADKFVTFRLHAPEVDAANAPGAIEGRTVTWRFPLDPERAEHEPPARLEAELGLGGHVWPWLLGLGLLLFALVWLRGFWQRGLLRRFLVARRVL